MKLVGGNKKTDTVEKRNSRLLFLGLMELIFGGISTASIYAFLVQSQPFWESLMSLIAGISGAILIFGWPYFLYQRKGKFWEVDKGIPKKRKS